MRAASLSMRGRSVFITGAIHWIAFERKPGDVLNLILLFDVEEERFKRMKLPESVVDSYIWVRKEYGVAKSWSKMYSVEAAGGVETPMLWLRPNGEFLVVAMWGELVSYDPKSQEAKDVGIVGITDAFYACTYTESLVLLDKESGALSYGGAKKKEKSSGAHVSEEEDESIMLDSEETASNTRWDSLSAAATMNFAKKWSLYLAMGKVRDGNIVNVKIKAYGSGPPV